MLKWIIGRIQIQIILIKVNHVLSHFNFLFNNGALRARFARFWLNAP